jgi:ABC-2 type transport system ATP-binding protein
VSETRSEKAPVLEVKDVAKTFRIGFFRKRVEAVKSVGFEVRDGEIFGLLGPNGAGKTTTLKMVLRLIFPDRGSIRLFGSELHADSMKRLGYMPENPYVYQYLRAPEFLDLCGRLTGMDRASRKRRTEEMLALVGLEDATDRPIGKFSKGMTQRIGLAQALLHDPELLILDEPMSGLDPVGRKEVRDVLVDQKKRGKTLIFTSHILSDVELLCDRVAIVQKGKVTAYGTLDELLREEGAEGHRIEIALGGVGDDLATELEELGKTKRRDGDRFVLEVTSAESVTRVLEKALAGGARVDGVTPHRSSLESYFVREEPVEK